MPNVQMRNENWRRTLRHATDELTPYPSIPFSLPPSLSISLSFCAPSPALSRQNQFGFAVFVHSQPAAAAAKAVVQFAGLPHVAAPAATAATAAHPGQLHFSLNTSKRITKRQPKLPFSLSFFSEASLSLAKLPASAQSFNNFFMLAKLLFAVATCHLQTCNSAWDAFSHFLLLKNFLPPHANSHCRKCLRFK